MRLGVTGGKIVAKDNNKIIIIKGRCWKIRKKKINQCERGVEGVGRMR